MWCVWWFPFVMVQDFYPAFRFGMFAERGVGGGVVEVWVIEREVGDGVWCVVNGVACGLDEGVYGVVKRNYCGRGECEVLLNRVRGVCGGGGGVWRCVREVYRGGVVERKEVCRCEY
jgi:hypothetical protein